MKVCMITLGCKVNQYESQAMLAMLEKIGFSASDSQSDCDLIVFNSCTVTGTSDQKLRQALRRARKLSPNAVIVLTGCMPQAFPEDAKKLSDLADIIVGNTCRSQLPDLVLDFMNNRNPIFDIPDHVKNEAFEDLHVEDFHERTRAFIKIEDGCNRFCSYCIIPTARGRVRSKSPDALRAELEAISAKGYREVVLVGINLSAYGQEMGLNLCDAVEIACSVDGIERVRLGSLEPDKMDDESIARLAALPKLCPQFHLALQSGCNSTLKAMHRHYSAEEYAVIADKLRNAFDNCSVTTDIMVGFPSETEEDFVESMEFLRKVGFARTHIFPYSPRRGTIAAKMPQLSNAVKEERAARTKDAASELRSKFLESQIGTYANVLFETPCGDGFYTGFTENYTPVRAFSEKPVAGLVCKVRIVSTDGDGCIGEIVRK